MPPLFAEDALDALRRFRVSGLARGMSARLLWLTILFVMIAEVLIFLPSAANHRTQWLLARLQAAELAALAVEAAPDAMLSDELAGEILASAEVMAVALMRAGMTEVILPGPTPPGPVQMIRLSDAREPVGFLSERIGSIYATCQTFLAREPRFLLVSAPRTRMGAPEQAAEEILEVLVAEAPLRRELIAFSQRIFGLSIFISLIAGGAVYLTLALVFVRPMRRLASAMIRFRENPEDAGRVITPSRRDDEIGLVENELATLQNEVRLALTQKARLAALGGAVAKINHDLRNVLTSAQLVSDRLAAHADPTVRGPAERLVRSIDRGVRLAEDVLAYGRADEPPAELSPVKLRPVLEDAFYDAAAAVDQPTGIDIRIDDELRVLADPEQLHRVFLNLLRNAAQAMAAQEDRSTPGTVVIDARSDDDLVVVSVTDEGPGVPEKARERLFQAFSTSARRGGSGLGLAIARELARAQGGDVDLAATGAEGSTFEVRLRAS